MGRRAEGWKLVWRIGVRFLKRWEDGATAYVRFTHKGTPFFLSTGEGDPRKADAACARLYADVVQRGTPKPGLVALAREPLSALFTRWVASLDGVLDEKTVRTYEGYVGAHFLAGFEDLNEIADHGRVRAYVNRRLKVVLKKSVLKELSALRGFLVWCHDEKIFGELPGWVGLTAKALFPSKATGKRAGAQREKANILSLAQMAAFLGALPEWSSEGRGGSEAVQEDPAVVARIRSLMADGYTYGGVAALLNREGVKRPRGGEWARSQVRLAALGRKEKTKPRAIGPKHFPVRARLVFAYETGLRPATLDEMLWSDVERAPAAPAASVGREVASVGGWYFNIRSEIDKNRYGRRVPLSALAIEALESLPHRTGLVFGKHDYRWSIRRAAKAAGIDLAVAPYDLRHGRATHLRAAGAPGIAVAFMHGHRRVTTTDKYTHPTEEAALAWVNALALPAAPPSPAQSAPIDGEFVEEVSQRSGSVFRTVSDQDEPSVVRRTGVEPVQELPHWNLNPKSIENTAENKQCVEVSYRQDSAESVAGRHNSCALYGFGDASSAAQERAFAETLSARGLTPSAADAVAAYIASGAGRAPAGERQSSLGLRVLRGHLEAASAGGPT